MKDINKHDGDNLGGIYSFKYIPVSEAFFMDKPVNGKLTKPLVTQSIGRWYDFYATEGSINFTENKEFSKQGDYYKAKLTGLVPKDRSDLIDAFTQMQNEQFIIDYTDNNGIRKIIGTIAEPLTFKDSVDVGTIVSNRNGTSFEFSGDLRFKSPEYFI